MIEILDLSDKDFKVVMLKLLQWAIKNTLETNVAIESLSKEREDIKKNQTKNLEMKNTITEILEKSMDRLKQNWGDRKKNQYITRWNNRRYTIKITEWE